MAHVFFFTQGKKSDAFFYARQKIRCSFLLRVDFFVSFLWLETGDGCKGAGENAG